MAGWIKIHRELQDHWLSQDMEKLGRWTSLLLMASYEDKKVLIGSQLVTLNKGQLIASNSFLAEKWNTSERTVGRFLDLLESDGMLHRCVHRKITIITICNYSNYQDKNPTICTDTCTDDAPIAQESRTEIKKGEEVKEINNNSFAHAREDEYVRRYREEGMWMDVALILHIKSIEGCKKLFDEFVAEYRHNGYTHTDYTDFKRHFIQWARIATSKRPAQPDNQRKITTNTDTFRLMREMGWQDKQ